MSKYPRREKLMNQMNQTEISMQQEEPGESCQELVEDYWHVVEGLIQESALYYSEQEVSECLYIMLWKICYL